MAAILSSSQTLLPEVMPDVDVLERLPLAFPTFWVFDRRSSSNIAGDTSI